MSAKIEPEKRELCEHVGETGIRARLHSSSGPSPNAVVRGLEFSSKDGERKLHILRWEAETWLSEQEKERERRDTRRFHLIFWPSATGTILTLAILLLSVLA